MVQLKLYLFGKPQLDLNDKAVKISRRKAFALLAYLAMAKHHQRREVVATLLWSELDHEHALASLRSTLSAMTSLSSLNFIDKEGTSLALNHQYIWVDVLAFQEHIQELRSHKHDFADLCPDCLKHIHQAVSLYRADFMEAFPHTDSEDFNQWQTIQAEALRRELASLLRRLAEYYGGTENFELALIYAQRYLSLDNLNEAAHRLLMRLYAANGTKNLALLQYQHCLELLDKELASSPDDETMQLYYSIQRDASVTFKIQQPRQSSISVLPAMPPLLVGRELVLEDLKAHLVPNDAASRTVVIQGYPGIGKSTIVAALAHEPEMLSRFPDGILWTSLGEVPNLATELSHWASALGITSSDKGIDSLSNQIANALRNRQALLIVDDVWQVEHAQAFNFAGQSSAIIYTSRLNEVAQALAPTMSDVYRLPVLKEDAALNLLARLSPETVNAHPNESRALVRDLEGLPLAIQVAGRLLQAEARLGWGVANLLEELGHGTALLDAQVPSDLQKHPQTASPTVAALLKRSTDLLDTAMRQRFALLGLFVAKPASFDLEALATIWQVNDPKPYIRVLVNRGLLEPSQAGRFQLHALLHLHARSLLEEMDMFNVGEVS